MTSILHVSHLTKKNQNKPKNPSEISDPDFFSQAHPQFIREKDGEEGKNLIIAYSDEESPCFQQQSWEGKLFWILAVNPIEAKIWSLYILKKTKVHPSLSQLLMWASFWNEGLCNHWHKTVRTSQQDLKQCHMVSNGGFFFSWFPRILRSLCSELNGIYDSFCPSQEPLPVLSIFLPEKQLLLHDVSGSNIFRRRVKYFS